MPWLEAPPSRLASENKRRVPGPRCPKEEAEDNSANSNHISCLAEFVEGKMVRDKNCSEQVSPALRSIISTLNSEAASGSEVRMEAAASPHEGSNVPSKVVVVDAATFNTAKSNVPYFSLETCYESHQNEPVIHDVTDWIRIINRQLSEHSDQTKCSVALNRAIGTAKNLIDELIEDHDSNWVAISTDYKVYCKQPEDCKELQIEILSLKRNHKESIQSLYTRASCLGRKLIRLKPQHTQWVQEELRESFAKAVSVKFFHSLAKEEKGNLRTLIGPALEYEAKESAIRASEERSKGLSIDTPDSNDKLVQAGNDILPSAEPEYSENSAGRRNPRISKRCYTCNSTNHLWRLCDQVQNTASHHTRRSYMTALLNCCFRCGSNRHETAVCYRNHKVCFRCRYRGHIARECASTPTEIITTRRSNAQQNEKATRTRSITCQRNDGDTEVTKAHHLRDSNPPPGTTAKKLIPKCRERIIDKEKPNTLQSKYIGGVYMGSLEDAKDDTDKKLEEMLKRCE